MLLISNYNCNQSLPTFTCQLALIKHQSIRLCLASFVFILVWLCHRHNLESSHSKILIISKWVAHLCPTLLMLRIVYGDANTSSLLPLFWYHWSSPLPTQYFIYTFLNYELFKKNHSVLQGSNMSLFSSMSSMFSNKHRRSNLPIVHSEEPIKPHRNIGETRFLNADLSSKLSNRESDSNGQSINIYVESSQAQDSRSAADRYRTLTKAYVPQLRMVHLDLKGAPPKISYLKEVSANDRSFPCFKHSALNSFFLYWQKPVLMVFCWNLKTSFPLKETSNKPLPKMLIPKKISKWSINLRNKTISKLFLWFKHLVIWSTFSNCSLTDIYERQTNSLR